jgi:hypothetical protein
MGGVCWPSGDEFWSSSGDAYFVWLFDAEEKNGARLPRLAFAGSTGLITHL